MKHEDIDAVAKALYENTNSMYPNRTWELAAEWLKNIYRSEARVVLSVITPLIAAKAWDEGFTAGNPIRSLGSPLPSRKDNPYRTPHAVDI